MTITSGTYRPVSAHQPRGGRPWCANCHTDKYLAAGFTTDLDAREQSLAVAVTCTQCGESRVLETTRAFAGALLSRAEAHSAAPETYSRPVHCKEPMSLVDPALQDLGSDGPSDNSVDAAHPGVLRCRCGFQMDAPPNDSGSGPTDQITTTERTGPRPGAIRSLAEAPAPPEAAGYEIQNQKQ